MKRKLIEWTVFGFIAVGVVYSVRWFVPWAAVHYYRGTARPVVLRLDPALRQHLRQTEDRLAVRRPTAPLGQSGAPPCLVVWAQAGVGAHQSNPPAGPVQDCLRLVPGDPPFNAVEINLWTGTPILVQTDMYLPGDPPMVLTRVVQPLTEWNRRFDVYLPNEYDTFPFGDRFPYTYQQLQLADLTHVLFDRISKGTGYADAVYEHAATRTVFYHAIEGWNGNGWDLDLADGRTLVFPEAYNSQRPPQGALTGLLVASGASLTFQRDRNGNLQSVRASDGRWMKFGYQGALIVSLEDSAGEKASYSYDGGNRLAASTNAGGETFSYAYDEQGELTAVRNVTKNKPVVEFEHHARGLVTSLRVAGSPSFRLAYRVDPTGRYPEVDLTDSVGRRWTVLIQACTETGCAYEVHPR